MVKKQIECIISITPSMNFTAEDRTGPFPEIWGQWIGGLDPGDDDDGPVSALPKAHLDLHLRFKARSPSPTWRTTVTLLF